MTDELMCLSIMDCNGVVIDFGEMLNARDFFISVSSPKEYAVFLRKCEYICVTKGMEQETDASGREVWRTTLKTGTFSVKVQSFIRIMTAWYTLQRRGRDWYADNKPTTAIWVKQRIQAALLPFGINQREITSIYQLLSVQCAASDFAVESLNIVTAADLNSKVFARPPFIVDGFMCASNLTLLAAPPKTGKSFLALDLACSIAEGRPFWGHKTEKGDVLYCDLEGTEGRTQERFTKIGRNSRLDCPASLYHAYRGAAQVDNGLIDQLKGWISSVESPKLIIIDTLQLIKGRVARGEDSYAADTRFMRPLHELAVEKNIGILVITHTRKASGFELADPFDNIIGSTAQYGNADAGWIISGKRDDNKKQFTAVGRDFEPVSFEIERVKDGPWVCNGTIEAIQEQNQQTEYQNDKAVAFVKAHLPKCGGLWRCTAQEFINAAARATGEYLENDPTRMSKRIRYLAPQLLKNDGIIVRLPDGGGRHGREFVFEQQPFTEQ